MIHMEQFKIVRKPTRRFEKNKFWKLSYPNVRITSRNVWYTAGNGFIYLRYCILRSRKYLQLDVNFTKNTGDYEVGFQTVGNLWTCRIKHCHDTLASSLIYITEPWKIKGTDERATAVISSFGMQNAILRIVREFSKILDFCKFRK